MDFLRLPVALRHSILVQSKLSRTSGRLASTTSHQNVSISTPTTTPPPPSKSFLSLSSGTLNSYTTSTTPAPPQLKHASAYFTRVSPILLFSTPHFRAFPPSPIPEVAFLGRSNVGKSSLLNALFGRPNEKPAHVSKRPGRTKTMNGFGIGGDGAAVTGAKEKAEIGSEAIWRRFGRGGLVVVDMPGYGSGSRGEWGSEIMKYLGNRQQLRRTYVLIDTEHGLKQSDMSLLLHLRQAGIAHQIVLSKVDKLLYPHAKAPGAQKLHNQLLKLQDTCRDIRQTLNEAAAEAGGRNDVMGDILCCSAEKSIDDKGRHRRIGIDELRWSVLSACGLEEKPLPKSKKDKKVRSEEAEEGSSRGGAAYTPMAATLMAEDESHNGW